MNLRTQIVDPPRTNFDAELHVVSEIVERFDLRNLARALAACREPAPRDAPLDVAVLGQFKAGKSSLLNALLGDELLPWAWCRLRQ